MKQITEKPKKSPNIRGGQCDLCGKDLGLSHWTVRDHTACSKKHADELVAEENAELEREFEDEQAGA